METIELKPMRLTPSAYFRLLVKIRLRRSGWIYGVFFVVGILSLMGRSVGQAPLGVILIVIPFITVGVLYFWAHRKDNQQICEERRFILDELKMLGISAGGGRSEIPWSYVLRMIEIDNRYLLYISAGQMIILDKAAFPDRASEERFLTWMKDVKRK